MATKKQRKRSSKKGRRPESSLEAVSARELQAELRRRERELVALRRKRDALVRQLADVEKRLRQHEAAGGRAPRKRPHNPVILVDVLKKVLDNQALSVTAAAEAVQKAGYKTTSPNFRTIVNQTLLANKRTFKKVARGTYTLRKK